MNPNSETIIRSVETDQELQQMLDVRWFVLRKPLGKEKGTEQDEYEQESFHALAINHNRIIGCARLRTVSAILGEIGFVAVLPEFQHQGIGRELMLKLIEQARTVNLQEIRLKSRYYCFEFYQKLGFIQSGEPFDFLGILHIPMLLKL